MVVLALSGLGVAGIVALLMFIMYLVRGGAGSGFGTLLVRHRLSATQLATLRKYSTFLQGLKPEDAHRFEHCAGHFLNDMEWVGAGMELAVEMKVMISASAAQLLFRLPDPSIEHFTRIIVYPDAYVSPRTGDLHQGTVMPKAGMIKISWEHFLHGYSHDNDAHNVALHEMAHAVWFEHLLADRTNDYLDAAAFAEWERLAATEIAMINAGESRLFRRYAGTNEAEFFACAVEYFFERTADFKEKMPAEYVVMCRLLKQDPSEVIPLPPSKGDE